MVEASSQNPVNMLDHREISLIQGILFRFMAMVQCNLLTIVNQSRMLKPKLPFQPRLFSNVFPKWRSQSPHHVCRELDQQTHHKETFSADGSRKRVIVYYHVEYGFGEVRVELG